MALSNIGAVTNTCCVTQRLCVRAAADTHHSTTRDQAENPGSDDEAGREGEHGIVAAQIIPFDGVQPVPSGEQYPEGDG